jgi:hypothetical protein
VNTEVKGHRCDRGQAGAGHGGHRLQSHHRESREPAHRGTHWPVALPSPATQSPTLNQSPGSITDEQKEQFKQLHALVMAAKGVGIDPAARSAAWAETLKPYSVASIREMSEETAARALAELGKQHDPFGHPAGKAGSSSHTTAGFFAPSSLSGWPTLLHDLLREYGERVVWLVGWRVLNYPPTWVTNGMEVFRLTEALRG